MTLDQGKTDTGETEGMPAEHKAEAWKEDEIQNCLAENTAWQDLSEWEIALSCVKIKELKLAEGSMSMGEIEEHLANLIKKDPMTIRRYLKLLSIEDEDILRAVHTGDITATTALDLSRRKLNKSETAALLAHIKKFPKRPCSYTGFDGNPEMSDKGKNWNVVTGCDKYSDGCLNCYAKDIVEWLKGMGQEVYIQHGFNVKMHDDRLDWPLKNLSKKPKRPARSFVTDMGDLFHKAVTDEFIKKVFEVMLEVPQHRFYVLTKRAERLGDIGPHLPWKPWIWAGVTVESDKYTHRINHLKKLPGNANKFLMLEPLLSPITELDLEGIDWVVVGGETNKEGKYRPLEKEWAIDIRDQVKNAGLPFMFKHWPGKTHNLERALLEGEIWAEFPESVLVNMDWGSQEVE